MRLTFKNELQQLWVGSAVSTQVRLPACLPAHLPPCPLPACPLEQTLTRCCVRCRWPHGQSLPGLVRLTVRLCAKVLSLRLLPVCLPLPQKVPFGSIAKIESQAIKGQEEYSSEGGREAGSRGSTELHGAAGGPPST